MRADVSSIAEGWVKGKGVCFPEKASSEMKGFQSCSFSVLANARDSGSGSELCLDVCLSWGCSFICDSNTTLLALPQLVPGPPQMPLLNEWARPEATPQMAKQFSHKGKEVPSYISWAPTVYQASPGLLCTHYHIPSSQQQPKEATIICSFHRGGSWSSAQQCEDSSPGWSNSCLCLLTSPHLLSAHALSRAQLLPHLLILTAALLVHSSMSTQLHPCSQAHMHQGGCTCVAQTGSPDCYLSAMKTGASHLTSVNLNCLISLKLW